MANISKLNGFFDFLKLKFEVYLKFSFCFLELL
jgi:hypothetical protein